MKKRFFIGIAAICMSSAALAEPFNGPYLGAQGGYDFYHADASAALAGFTGNADLGSSGGSLGLFGGYGKTIGSLYFGGELEASLNNAEISFRDSGGDNVGIKAKNTVGGNIRIGFLPTKSTLLYASAGIVTSKFDGEDQFTGSKSLTGGRFGLGVETALSSAVTGRLSWSYTDYQDYQVKNTTLKLSPSESLFRIGVAYNF